MGAVESSVHWGCVVGVLQSLAPPPDWGPGVSAEVLASGLAGCGADEALAVVEAMEQLKR